MKTLLINAGCLVLLALTVSACQKEQKVLTQAPQEVTANLATIEVLKAATDATKNTNKPLITVYKSATCGCCEGWVSYLEEEGYTVSAINKEDMNSVKAQLGLHDAALHSCHTATVNGYVIEGHVPVADIDRLLREQPANIKGLTAPGMPMMSPGMGSRIPKGYAVLAFTEAGEAAIYSQY